MCTGENPDLSLYEFLAAGSDCGGRLVVLFLLLAADRLTLRVHRTLRQIRKDLAISYGGCIDMVLIPGQVKIPI